MSKYLLIFPLILVILISGCTVPGLGIEIPFLPDFFGTPSIDYANDILVIRSIQATPSATIKGGQTLTVYIDFENFDRPEKGPLKANGSDKIFIELYDYCSNLMEEVNPICSDGTAEGNTKCVFEEIMPKEVKSVRWELKPKKLDLEQSCTLKFKVSYPYSTEAITQVSFIDENELQNRIRRGESYQVSGSEVRGEGPVKPYMHVESQQPISTASNGQISLQVKNVGSGYVKDSVLTKDVQASYIGTNKPSIVLLTGDDTDPSGSDNCILSGPNRLKLINKETSPVFCQTKIGSVNIEETFNLRSQVEYVYEFRKNLNIKIMPEESAL